jgi:hypothetical protein
MFVNNCVYTGRVQYVQRALDIADNGKYLEAIVKFFDHHSRHVNEEVFSHVGLRSVQSKKIPKKSQFYKVLKNNKN